MKYIILLFIKFYQFFISPWLGSRNCCYFPTCSDYAKEAVNNFGAIKGLYLVIMRILKCHPFSEGGYDPVPPQCKNK
ncbi:MAG: membrane protein insertion efficiency factor YidD [Rickettsiaceae bacterium]